MHVSEARRLANIENAKRSTGPTSPEGRANSSRNSLKHGLTGEGIAVGVADQEVIASRAEAFTSDMKPRTAAGSILILQMAMLSVRMEKASQHESAAIARNVRHAAEDFDQERLDLAEKLIDSLGENPRANLRKLKKMPEGVDLMIEAWQDLRAHLSIEPTPLWTAAQLEQAGHLTGLKTELAPGSHFGALSRALWGDFAGLGLVDGGDLDEASRQQWAKNALIKRIDAEIAALEAHRATLDFTMIEIDRIEAGGRALFDASRDAILARRYEADASRRFFKALKEFRQVEAEFAAQSAAVPIASPVEKVGSFCETTPRPQPEPVRTLPEPATPPIPVAEPRENRRARRAKLAKSRR